MNKQEIKEIIQDKEEEIKRHEARIEGLKQEIGELKTSPEYYDDLLPSRPCCGCA